MTRRLVLAAIFLFCTTGALAQSNPEGVHAKLSLADQKTTFRIGEPILLVLELSADREGYSTDIIPDGEPIHESVSVSPESGVTRWVDDYLAGGKGFRDYFSYAKLSTTPARVPFYLNDHLRFDRAGRYSIRVTTTRVLAAPEPTERPGHVVLATNEITLNIESMSDDEEDKEVRRLSDELARARGWQAEEKVARQLAYLAGEPATREKIRRFLNGGGLTGNYQGQILHGLFIARNRGLVLQLLESALRDSSTPVTSSLLGVTSRMRLLRQNAGSVRKPAAASPFTTNSDPAYEEIRDAYLAELAAGLSRRAGKSQTTTAMTILMNLPKETGASGAVLREVRRILVQQFETLHPYDQEYLLRQYWDKVRDPSLVPALKRMLQMGGVASKNIHDAALKRLIEIAPQEARPAVIAEIRDPKSLVDFEILSSLEDKYLPEVDASLLDQLRQLTASKTNFDRVYLKHKASLAARYASEGIYADLMNIYQQAGSGIPIDARAGFLAYFARHNEPEAMMLIEQTLETLDPGQDFQVLPDLTKLFYSNSINLLLRRRLESDQPQTASTAAYLISLHGPAADQEAIEARLKRWRRDWSDRLSEADANSQGTVERELVMALTRAKSWKLSSEDSKALQESCVSKICRQNFQLK